MKNKAWERIGAGTGLGFVALALVASFVVPQPPKVYDPVAKTLTYIVTHRTGLLWQSYLIGLAVVALLWFAGSLRATLWRAEGDTGRLANVAFAGAVTVAGIAIGGQALNLTLAYNLAAIPTAGPGAVLTLYSIQAVAFTLIYFPMAVMVGATSVVIIRHDALPSWLGVVGIPAAVAMLAAGGTYRATGAAAPTGSLSFIAFLLFAVWIAATSVAMIARIGSGAEAKTIYLDQPQRERLMTQEMHETKAS